MKRHALVLLAALAALAILPARASDEQLTCTPGATVQIAGTAPPVTPLLARFGGRVVAGSMSDAAGAYTIALKMGQERPGTYPVTVEVRGSGAVLQRLVCVVPGATGRTAIPDATARATTPVRAPTAATGATVTPRAQAMPPFDAATCEQSYPDFCIPAGKRDNEVNCGADVGYNQGFTVREPDPYRLDGNNNGKGCEDTR